MGRMGNQYGSEWHLLRYLGYHRQELNSAILSVMPDVQQIHWQDFRFSPDAEWVDRELKGVEFLPTDHSLRLQWKKFWPSTGNSPNWDAVARLTLQNAEQSWMLIEAKGHLGELRSNCAAVEAGGLSQIRQLLAETQQHYCDRCDIDWTQGYYQHANRLAVLHFLNSNSTPARLLNIYFLGDTHPTGICPTTAEQWKTAIDARNKAMGINSSLPGVYSLFLPVCGAAATN